MPAYYAPQPVQYQHQMPPPGPPQQGYGMHGGYGAPPQGSYGGGYHDAAPPSHHQASSSGGGSGGGDSNMAGFGARRFAEKQAKAAAAAQAQARAADEAAQRAEWERQEYERYHAERAAYERERQEEDRMRWEENKAAEEAERRRAEQERARLEWEAEEREREHVRRREAEERQRHEYEEQQRRRQHQQQEEEDARRQEKAEQARRYEQDQRERQRASDERRRAQDTARAQENSIAALRAARKEEQAAAAAAAAAAATAASPATTSRPRADSRTAAARPVLKPSTSSSSDDAWARNAAAAAAYDQKRAREQASVPTRSATLDSVSTASAHLAYDEEAHTRRSSGEQRRIGLGIASAAARETLYEDDFEESVDDNRRTWRPAGNATARYTQYGGDVDIDADVTIGAVTASTSGGLQVPASPKAASGARRSMAFVSRHDEVPMAKCADCGNTIAFEELASHTCMRSGGALSPASPYFASGGLPPHGGAESPANERLSPSTARSPFFDKYNRVLDANGSGRNSPAFIATTPRSASYDEHTPRTLSRENARSPALSSRTLTSPLVSPALSSPGLPDGTDPMEAARIIAERKRQIEAQREAARNKGGAALAATAVSAALRFKSGSKSPAPHADDVRMPSPRERSPPRASENKVHAKALSNSSSISSVQSSLLDPSSPRSRAKAREASSRGVDGGVSPVSTSALTPSSSYDHMSEEEGMAAARRKHVENVSAPILSKDPASWRAKKVATPTLPSSEVPASTRPSRRPEIDLGGIEDLLQDLTAESPAASPKPPAQPEHVAKPGAAQPRSRSKSKPPALQIDASTSAVTSWQRRQERELRNEGSSSKRSQQRRTKRCDVCLLNLTDSKTPFVERDGKVLCASDYAILYLPKCRKCTEPVESDAVKSSDGALKGIFHRDCFSCFCCDQKFEDGVFYCLNNAPYCAKHYHALNGTLCKGCGEGIEGQCRQTEGAERYHPRCFTCTYESDSSFCSEPLEDYFVVGGRRLCEWHAQKMQKALQKGGRDDNVKALRRQTILKALA